MTPDGKEKWPGAGLVWDMRPDADFKGDDFSNAIRPFEDIKPPHEKRQWFKIHVSHKKRT